jgi:hypothetical protein
MFRRGVNSARPGVYDRVTSGEESQLTMLFAIVPFKQLASYERADGGVLTGATGENVWFIVAF